MDKKIFLELNSHMLEDEKPSIYIKELSKKEKFSEYPFSMLADLKNTEQSPVHHPEGSVWNHTMMVVDEAAKARKKSENEKVFMWTALLHDIGKAPTTKLRKGRITSYDHDKHGKEMSKKFLKEFSDDEKFIEKVSSMVRWHMQPLFVVKDLPFAEIDNMLREVSLDEIALFSQCDRLGRGRMDDEKFEKEIENTRIFIDKCKRHSEMECFIITT